MLMPDRFGESPFGLGDEDWRVLTTARVHVMLVGPDPLTSQIVGALRPTFGEPVAQWIPNEGIDPSRPCRTLLLPDAGQLTLDDQQRLDEWLTSGCAPQVVTMASTPLFPLVEQGRFLASLYYRLNVVYLSFEPAGYRAGLPP